MLNKDESLKNLEAIRLQQFQLIKETEREIRKLQNKQQELQRALYESEIKEEKLLYEINEQISIFEQLNTDIDRIKKRNFISSV